MITTSSNLFFHAKNKTILFFAFFLFGCQMMPDSTPPMRTASSASEHAQFSTMPTTSSSAVAGNNGMPVMEQRTEPQQPRSAKYETESEKLQQCQSQLDALKVMSPAQYAKMRNSFDYLMNGAAQYANIRQKINSDTQDTVDSLYRYRANLLCAQIAQTLLDGLTRRGEARP